MVSEQPRYFRGISIHVPREGDDSLTACAPSTTRISIHVPREGDDTPSAGGGTATSNFYPRPPRGGRQQM